LGLARKGYQNHSLHEPWLRTTRSTFCRNSILLLSGLGNKAPHPVLRNHEKTIFPACACLKQAFEFVSGV
jgi:hypothetical protein